MLLLTFEGFRETSQDCTDSIVLLLEVRSGIRTLFLCVFPPYARISSKVWISNIQSPSSVFKEISFFPVTIDRFLTLVPCYPWQVTIYFYSPAVFNLWYCGSHSSVSLFCYFPKSRRIKKKKKIPWPFDTKQLPGWVQGENGSLTGLDTYMPLQFLLENAHSFTVALFCANKFWEHVPPILVYSSFFSHFHL